MMYNEGVIVGLIAFFIIYLIIIFAIAACCIIAMWKLFTKAGKPGWAAIVPFYNWIVFLQIAKKPWWYLLPGIIAYVLMIISSSTANIMSLSLYDYGYYDYSGGWMYFNIVLWFMIIALLVVGIVFWVKASINFAKAFGKSAGYGVGLFFIFPIMGMILAFNKNTQYVGLPDPADEYNTYYTTTEVTETEELTEDTTEDEE